MHIRVQKFRIILLFLLKHIIFFPHFIFCFNKGTQKRNKLTKNKIIVKNVKFQRHSVL